MSGTISRSSTEIARQKEADDGKISASAPFSYVNSPHKEYVTSDKKVAHRDKNVKNRTLRRQFFERR